MKQSQKLLHILTEKGIQCNMYNLIYNVKTSRKIEEKK